MFAPIHNKTKQNKTEPLSKEEVAAKKFSNHQNNKKNKKTFFDNLHTIQNQKFPKMFKLFLQPTTIKNIFALINASVLIQSLIIFSEIERKIFFFLSPYTIQHHHHTHRNQKNMRETCRRVEINLHYELLYHSLGQNLVYNRAERVQLLRKAIIKMAELKAHCHSLSDQVRSAGMTPTLPPNFQLNDSR